jgi:hypothetical protein
MDDVDLTRDIETREESYALSAAAELIADEYHDDTKGGEWTSEIRWAVRKAWIAGRNWERRQQTAQNEAAILEVERSTERWTTLTSARQADKAEIERFIGLNVALATEIERLRGLLREAKSLLFATQHPMMDGSEHQAVKDFLARPLGL